MATDPMDTQADHVFITVCLLFYMIVFKFILSKNNQPAILVIISA